jgi:Cu2+-exporting ATPase
MKTVTVDVGGLLSPLSVRGVEKQLAKLPGVERADVNFAAGTATVVYDETRTTLAAIKAAVRACGYHCTGEQVPRHVCEPVDPPGHVHAAGALGIPPVEAVAKPAPVHAGHPAPHAAVKDEMAHEMGHGAGMDMQAMVRDMRNRFWICLVFTVPIFVYSPMGGMFTPPAPPFGLSLDRWLFLLATIAVIYPSWPFVVAAWRALKTGVLNMAVLIVLSVGVGYVFSVGASVCSPRNSTKRWRCCSCSSSWGTGSRCAPVPARPRPSAPSWISRRPKRLWCATAARSRCPPRMWSQATSS